jgi:hypothetical protein
VGELGGVFHCGILSLRGPQTLKAPLANCHLTRRGTWK